MKSIECTVHELEIKYTPGNYQTHGKKVTSSQEAAFLLQQVFDPDTIQCQEEIVVLYMDRNNTIKGVYKLGKGGISSTTVDVRLILSVALKSLATAIVLCHNHPSGNILPSEMDKRLTWRLKDACALLEIELLDHIIVTAFSGYYSFKDEGML